jgi:protein-disulfide isomerase
MTQDVNQTVDQTQPADRGTKINPLADRRQFLLGTVALVAVAAGGYFGWGGPDTAMAQAAAGGGEVAVGDLMVPGPLGDLAEGSDNAPVTIVEYASMTCPHCAHFHETTYPELKKKYIDTGKVRFIFREFPLDALAAAGSMLARCAGKDKYFPMIETLFSQQKEWVVQKPLQPMLALAKQAGFTQESFDQCLANQQVLDGIEASRTRAAQKFNVNSTPTFFINGKIFRGALTPEELDTQLAPYLKG